MCNMEIFGFIGTPLSTARIHAPEATVTQHPYGIYVDVPSYGPDQIWLYPVSGSMRFTDRRWSTNFVALYCTSRTQVRDQRA